MKKALSECWQRLEFAFATFNPLSGSIQLGRAIMALGEMTVLLFTPWTKLSPEVLGQSSAPDCRGVSKASLFCMIPSTSHWLSEVLCVLVLLLVILGLFPRYVGFAHAWIAFSIAVGIGLPDGGEQVAQVVAMLLALMTLADGRVCAWKKADRGPVSPIMKGIAYSSWWMIRIQIAVIYLQAGISKLGVADWVNGTAMYYIVRDPSFGATGPVGDILRAVTANPVGAAAMTWVPILAEVILALLLFKGTMARKIAVMISFLLHIGIILAIGLWSFGLIMVGAVAAAACVEFGFVSNSQRALGRTFHRSSNASGKSKQLLNEPASVH